MVNTKNRELATIYYIEWRWCERPKYKFKWRYDLKSVNCNLSNSKSTRKNFGLHLDSNPWPLRKRYSALPAELRRPIHWEQANLRSNLGNIDNSGRGFWGMQSAINRTGKWTVKYCDPDLTIICTSSQQKEPKISHSVSGSPISERYFLIIPPVERMITNHSLSQLCRTF